MNIRIPDADGTHRLGGTDEGGIPHVSNRGRAYVSGAISAKTGESKERKLQKFKEAEAYLVRRGFDVVNPLNVGACKEETCKPPVAPYVNDAPPPPQSQAQPGEYEHTWDCYMRHDIADLMTCTFIFMIPGWHGSTGARIEHDIARWVNIEVHYLTDENLNSGAFSLDQKGKRA